MKTYKVKEGSAGLSDEQKQIEVIENVDQTEIITKVDVVSKIASLQKQLDAKKEELVKIDEALSKEK